MSVSVFVPVYNEAGNIDNVVSEITGIMDSITDDYELLFINDGSIDDSAEKITDWIKKNPKINVIEHKENLGYGCALKSGFNNAKKDLILYADADMHVDLKKLTDILPFTENYDLIIGYRVGRKFTLRRLLYSKIYNFLLRVFLGIKVKDANCSFKCIKRHAQQKIKLTAKSVFIDGELLAEAMRNNLTIKEIPFLYRPRTCGKSKFDSLTAAFSALREIIAYWLRRAGIKNKQ